MILPTIVFGAFVAIHVLLIIGSIKDLIPDIDEIEFQRKMLETMKKRFK
jgi:hypothetical protein